MSNKNHYEKMKHLITKVMVLKVDVNFCDVLVYIHVNVYIYYNSWEYASKIHWIIIYKLKNLVSEQT